MDTVKLKNYYQKDVVIDNNILTEFMEITAALEMDYMNILNQLFCKIVIPTPILEHETIDRNLESLHYEEGTFSSEIGYRIFMNLSNDPTAKQLSEYDKYVIAIAGESNILVASNDKPVREICKEYDLEVTGTLGIISSAYENNLVSFKKMKQCFKFLFSKESSCYLSLDLREIIYNHYSINDQ